MIPVSKLPYLVEVQDVITEYNEIGMPVEVWKTVAVIRADVQPLGGEMAQREYGIVETGITARLFCNPSEAVHLARRVVHKGGTYEIRHIADYRGHIEALLRPEVV